MVKTKFRLGLTKADLNGTLQFQDGAALFVEGRSGLTTGYEKYPSALPTRGQKTFLCSQKKGIHDRHMAKKDGTINEEIGN